MTADINNKSIVPGPAEMLKYLTDARSSYASYKDQAMFTVANVFMLYQNTMSSHAITESKDWVNGEIAKRNQEIELHNKELQRLRERVALYAKEQLPQDDLIFMTGKTPEEKKMIADEKKKLDALKKRDKKEWAAERLMAIEAREEASPFTIVVKFALQLDQPNQSNTIYRFASACEWIEKKAAKRKASFASADEIVEMIRDAGGFEVILEEARLLHSGKDDEAEDRKIENKEILATTKAALKIAKSKAVINMDSRFERDGLVMLVGKKNGGTIEVIDEVNPGEGEFNRILGAYEDPTLLPVADSTEFVSRLFELGSLIEEEPEPANDRATSLAEQKPGKQRILTLRTNAEERQEFVMSMRNGDASVVIYAWPNEGIDLGVPTTPMFMRPKFRRALEKKLKTYERRRLIDLDVEYDPKQSDGKTASESPMAWLANNSALKKHNRASAMQKFFWYDLTEELSLPLDVYNFRPIFKVPLSNQDLTTIYEKRLKDWAESKDPNKHNKTYTIKYTGKAVSQSVKGDKIEQATSVAEGAGKPAELTFRTRDIYEVMVLLAKQHAKEFIFEGDTGGLVAFTWSDSLATYRLYLPLAAEDGRLLNRRVEPMRFEHDAEAEEAKVA